MNSSDITSFRKEVWLYYERHGRHDLPWRGNINPYKVLVSEVMLQQTQVPRVIEKYKSFVKKFPSVRTLASAPLSDVLKEWNGLGYNKRAKHLHDAAKHIAQVYGGVVPRDYAALRSIPGIGAYTANAVRVFAFDEGEVLVETNVRTAIIHHFLPQRTNIEDFDIEKLAAAAAEGQDPREWHSALFDYGSFLKQNGVRTNYQTATYTKQSEFEGSLRQVRGGILKELHQGPSALRTLPFEKARMSAAIAGLERDGLIKKEKGKWRVA